MDMEVSNPAFRDDLEHQFILRLRSLLRVMCGEIAIEDILLIDPELKRLKADERLVPLLKRHHNVQWNVGSKYVQHGIPEAGFVKTPALDEDVRNMVQCKRDEAARAVVRAVAVAIEKKISSSNEYRVYSWSIMKFVSVRAVSNKLKLCVKLRPVFRDYPVSEVLFLILKDFEEKPGAIHPQIDQFSLIREPELGIQVNWRSGRVKGDSDHPSAPSSLSLKERLLKRVEEVAILEFLKSVEGSGLREIKDVERIRVSVAKLGQEESIKRLLRAMHPPLPLQKLLMERWELSAASQGTQEVEMWINSKSEEYVEAKEGMKKKAKAKAGGKGSSFEKVVDSPVLFESLHSLAVNKPPGVTSECCLFLLSRSRAEREEEVEEGKSPKRVRVSNSESVEAMSGEKVEVEEHYEEGGKEVKDEKGLALVSRLDRETSGVLLMAKTRESAAHWNQQFMNKDVKKVYFAICHGAFDKKEDVIDFKLKESGKGGAQKTEISPGGKDSKTSYQVVETRTLEVEEGEAKEKEKVKDATLNAEGYLQASFSLVKCVPLTGRTHQIRAHLSAIGHPIVGDFKYTPKKLRNRFKSTALLALKKSWSADKMKLPNREDLRCLLHCCFMEGEERKEEGMEWGKRDGKEAQRFLAFAPLPKDFEAFFGNAQNHLDFLK